MQQINGSNELKTQSVEDSVHFNDIEMECANLED